MTTEYTDKEEARPIRLEDLTEEQKFIFRRFSTMVREVLTSVESASTIPLEDRRFQALRRTLNDKMYSTRDDVLRYFSLMQNPNE